MISQSQCSTLHQLLLPRWLANCCKKDRTPRYWMAILIHGNNYFRLGKSLERYLRLNCSIHLLKSSIGPLPWVDLLLSLRWIWNPRRRTKKNKLKTGNHLKSLRRPHCYLVFQTLCIISCTQTLLQIGADLFLLSVALQMTQLSNLLLPSKRIKSRLRLRHDFQFQNSTAFLEAHPNKKTR